MNKLKIPAAFLLSLLLSVSVYSQSVISSVSVSKAASTVSKNLSASESETEIITDSENWMSHKSYLDFNAQLSIKEMMVINEVVIEMESYVEAWMNDMSEWQLKYPVELNVMEEPKPLEKWMSEDGFWQLKTEKQWHPVENWMTDRRFWNAVN